AGVCEATCCAGWEIVIDDDSIDKYLEVKSEFGNRLCNSIDFTEGVFHQDKNKRCAFLNDENLCDIYSEIGEEYLCYTCTQYPRHIEEFEEVNEVSLSISCPEVANMLLNCEEKLTFYEEEINEEVEPFEDFDFLFYEILYEAREVMFRILQNRNLTIDERMELTLQMSIEIQEKIDEYATFEIDEILEKYELLNAQSATELIHGEAITLSEAKTLYNRRQGIIMDLYKLEVLQDEWRPYLLESQTTLYEISYVDYQEKRNKFVKENNATLERMKEQLMMYFVYSYFCGAVYDGEAHVKYLLAHVATNIIEELWFALYIGNQEEISNQEMCRIAYRYAREIEHSDLNLETLEEIYKTYKWE
ncbi:MAG: flagellin lysine-N-methylase, partial [Eubacteriales bacterium]